MGKKREAKKNPRKIFTYWVSMPNSGVPPYIQFCLQTWFENIPDLELVIINHENLFRWIDPLFDMRAFLALSLPMQSDIVSYAVLQKHGGIFMDADTIVTKDIFAEIEKFERNKVYFFGNPQQKTVHLAFVACLKPCNKGLLSCVEQVKDILQKLVQKGKAEIEWNTFGNGVVDNVIKDDVLSDTIRILDRVETGAILEASFLNEPNAKADYLGFYFNYNNKILLEEVVEKINFGAVCLHNSWTPEGYKSLTLEQILKDDLMISKLLRYALGNNF